MSRGTYAAAGLAALTIVSTVVAYITKGTVPDVLTMVTTTAVGGFLGVTIPAPHGAK